MQKERQPMKFADLKPDPNNARIHDAFNIESIKNSLLKFGQYRPFVLQKSSNKIIVGNGMYEAIKQLQEEGRWKGGDEFDCTVLEVDDSTAALISAVDNRTSELGAWNDQLLASLLSGLDSTIDPANLGFDEKFVVRLLEEVNTPEKDRFAGDEFEDEPVIKKSLDSGKFILAYNNKDEREKLCDFLGVPLAGKKMVFRADEIPSLKKKK